MSVRPHFLVYIFLSLFLCLSLSCSLLRLKGADGIRDDTIGGVTAELETHTIGPPVPLYSRLPSCVCMFARPYHPRFRAFLPVYAGVLKLSPRVYVFLPLPSSFLRPRVFVPS